MSLPYFPMFPTDFEAKTSHLTLEEDGAYNRLLRIMWMTPGCSLPDDDEWIRRRMRVDPETFERVVRGVISEFCTRKDGRVSNPKLTRVFAESAERHSRRVSAGSKGGKAKALKTKETGPSNAQAKPKQPKPELDVKEEANASSKKNRGSRLPADWVLPRDWGEWALSQQIPEPAVRVESEKFRDYWHSVAGQKGVKLDWYATWRNWIRNANIPRVVNGGRYENTSKARERLDAFVSGARGTP